MGKISLKQNIENNTITYKIKLRGEKMNKKILLALIALFAIICCCSVVSADTNKTYQLGEIISSEFDFTQSYSGAGNSFSVSTQDGSISPNGNSKLDLDYNFTINIDTSQVSKDVSSQLDKVSSKNATCDFVISDGDSSYKFEKVPCKYDKDDGSITISGSRFAKGIMGMAVDLNNCEITKCSIKFDGNDAIFETSEK